jgi:hypothetical protein
MTGLLLVLGFIPLAAFGDEVVLTKGEKTVKATIGDEPFLAFQFNVGRKKPFFLPIAAPGGVELLKAAIAQGGDSRVFVVQENAEVHDAESKPLAFGEIVEISKVEGTQLHLYGREGWIDQRDAIPLAATVTRLINDHPSSINDPKDPDYYDHLHHKGLWFSVDEVNGIKFWKEDGKIVTKSVEVESSHSDPAVMKIVNHWMDDAGGLVLKESTTVKIYANRLLSYEAELEPGDKPVDFEDTKEGFFAIRLPNSMREIVGGGPVINAEGVVGSAASWGKPSPWIDYAGPVGKAQLGVAIMDDPHNFRPSRYHVRDYGLFAISPFGEGAYTNGAQPAAPVKLEPGKKLSLHYGLYVHRGDSTEGHVAETYQEFLKSR